MSGPNPTSPSGNVSRFVPGAAITDRYQVRRLLGQAPLGERYVCHDRHRARVVLMQCLDPSLAQNSTLRSRFVECVEVLKSEDCPFFIEIHDVIDGPELTAVITQLIEGPTLADYLEHYGPLPLDIGASLFRDVAEALLELHEKFGHAHGALSPTNIWLEQKGQQLVPHLQGLEQAVMQGMVPALAESLAPYRAPELTANSVPTPIGDIYGLGVALFEAFTGLRPTGRQSAELRDYIPSASDDLEGLIAQSTVSNAEVRFQSMLAIRNILDSISLEHQDLIEEKRPERPEIGDIIAGQYVIKSLLGEGGMARVYLAGDEMLGTTVAIKLLNATCLAEPEVVERFLDEASIQAQLVHPEPHPNVVAVLRVLRQEPIGFVMEFVPGTTLDELAIEQPLNLADWIDLYAQVCAGLEHAHKHRIIHRDLKPSNILVGIDEKGERTAKLMDFGISKQLDQPKTRTNLVLGTLGYLSPELFGSAKDASIQSDLYAIGCCLFESLTGQVPFPVDGGLRQLAFRVYSEPPPRPSEFGAEMPLSLEALIMMCLAKKPEDRPSSAIWLHDRLRSILEEREDPLLQETVKTIGLKSQRSGIFGGGSSTLRQYVSKEQIESARNTGRLVGANVNTLSGVSSPMLPPPPEQRSSNRKALVLALIVLLLVGAAIAAWLLTRPEPSEPAPTPVVQETKPPAKGSAGIVLSAGDLLAQAEKAAAEGDKEKALALIQQAIKTAEQDPNAIDTELLVKAAEMSADAGDIDGASEALARAAERGDGDNKLHELKAIIDLKRGDIDAAIASRDVLCDDPENKEICDQIEARMRAQADGYLAAGELDKAQKTFSGGTTTSSNEERTRFLSKLGEAAEEASDLDRAAKAYQEASQVDDESFDWRWKQADIAFKRQKFQRTLELLALAKKIASTPEETQQVQALEFLTLQRLAEGAINSGDDASAVRHLSAAISVAPDSKSKTPIQQQLFGIHTTNADDARANNDPTTALEELKRALEFAPDAKSRRNIEQRIKRLERMLKGRRRGPSDTTNTPLPPDQIQLWIESKPDRARVYQGSRALGRTPLITRLPKVGVPITLRLKLPGYYEESLEVNGSLGGQYNTKLRYRPREIK